MEKCLFIYNPESGKGKIKSKEDFIVSRLSKKYDVEVVHSQYAGNISKVLLERGEEFALIVGAGGDGTLNEIVDCIMRLDKKPLLGYIPSGTVNDVAHSLYIPRNAKKAVDCILNGQPYSHDIMKINDRYGIYVCAAGLFTGASSIFSTKSIKLKIKYEGGEIEGRYAIILINNSRYTAGMPLNKKVNLCDGLVDVMLIESKKEKVNLITVIKTIFMFLRGIDRYINKKHVHHLQLPAFRVETNGDTIINLDGEKVSSGSFDVEVIQGGIEIIVPKINKLKKQIKNID